MALKRTNTPLQALLLLNDETFVEHSRGLGTRMLLEGGDSDARKLRKGFLLALGRQPSPEELKVLLGELSFQRGYFRGETAAAREFLSVGESKPEMSAYDVVELAALTSVARVLLNLDETLTKE